MQNHGISATKWVSTLGGNGFSMGGMDTQQQHETPPYAHGLRPEEVFSYARKSVIKRDGDNKSIDDQHECNLETAEDYNLPLSSENVLAEEKNHGGDEYWEGGGKTGLEDGDDKSARTRPVLTRLVRGIQQGKIKCVIVWSLDRLWRSVSICEVLIDLMGRKGCHLYDRNGYVDILTPEGRASVLNNALNAQSQREMCMVNSPRGVRKTREKRRPVVTGNVVGFRHISRGKIKGVPDEIELVRRIFTMYCSGMSILVICRQLMDEGVVLAPELYECRSIKRTEETYHIVYAKQIKTILTDCRYQGRQPHEGQEWACDAFLVDGKPAIDPALYEQAQELLNLNKRVANAAAPNNYLAGLFRCGHCGQYLTINPVKQKNGSVKRYWFSKKGKFMVQCWCTHPLPNITEPAMRAYTENVLMPYLLAELEDMAQATSGTDEATDIVLLRQRIAEEQQTFEGRMRALAAGDEIPTYSLHLMENAYFDKVRGLKTRVQELETALRMKAQAKEGEAQVASLVERWRELSDDEKRVAVHSVLRWVVLLPSEDFLSRPERKGGARSIDRKAEGAPPAGKVVYLTAWGAFHTAIVCRVPNPETTSWHKPLGLVPASVEECLGSAAELPDPALFAKGLERSYKGRGYRYHPSEVMPGYATTSEVFTLETD